MIATNGARKCLAATNDSERTMAKKTVVALSGHPWKTRTLFRERSWEQSPSLIPHLSENRCLTSADSGTFFATAPQWQSQRSPRVSGGFQSEEMSLELISTCMNQAGNCSGRNLAWYDELREACSGPTHSMRCSVFRENVESVVAVQLSFGQMIESSLNVRGRSCGSS